jgi:curli biogenesis system outer membrane secretion channel CsgG
MNTKVLLFSVVVTAFAFTTFAAEPLLSPRAKDNQTKLASGTANDSNPALACRKAMTGSPKAVAECSSQTTMPGCLKMAASK